MSLGRCLTFDNNFTLVGYSKTQVLLNHNFEYWVLLSDPSLIILSLLPDAIPNTLFKLNIEKGDELVLNYIRWANDLNDKN